jgi:hypothetical protein
VDAINGNTAADIITRFPFRTTMLKPLRLYLQITAGPQLEVRVLFITPSLNATDEDPQDISDL